jgi:hypothetical protein
MNTHWAMAIWTPCKAKSRRWTAGPGSSAWRKPCTACTWTRTPLSKRCPAAPRSGWPLRRPWWPARCAAAGRTHQPPGPGLHRMAGGLLMISRAASSPSPTTAPSWTTWPRASWSWTGGNCCLPRELCCLPGAKGRTAGPGGRHQGQGRQAAGAGRGVDPQGCGSPAHPRAGAHRPAGRIARQARSAPRCGGQRQYGRRTSGAASGKLVAELTHVSKTFGDAASWTTSPPRFCAATRLACWAPTARARPPCSR